MELDSYRNVFRLFRAICMEALDGGFYARVFLFTYILFCDN